MTRNSARNSNRSRARHVSRWLVGLLGLGLVMFTWRTVTATSTRSVVAGRSTPGLCPYQTPEEWQLFLDRYADNEKWVQTCEDSSCDADFYQFVKENVQDTFDACTDFIARHQNIARCTRNMRRFTPTWLRQHDSDSYGFNVNNHTYLTRQDAANKPPNMMKPPAEIVAALPDRRSVEKAARDHGWKYLTHDSALDGYRTFVIYSDPQGRFDQWMLLNLQTGKTSVKKDTPLSVLVVQKKDALGNRLPRVRLHFRDYTITPTRGDHFRVSLFENNNGKCYSCHASGMRQLIARRTPILESRPSRGELGYSPDDSAPVPSDFAYQRLMEFNRKIRSYGSPDWDGMIFPENIGPALGGAQGCTDCHDGRSRGILTVATSPVQLEQKVYKEMSMPPDTDLPRWLERNQMQNPALSEQEQRALKKALSVHADLYEEFMSSRFPALRQWFLETSCR